MQLLKLVSSVVILIVFMISCHEVGSKKIYHSSVSHYNYLIEKNSYLDEDVSIMIPENFHFLSRKGELDVLPASVFIDDSKLSELMVSIHHYNNHLINNWGQVLRSQKTFIGDKYSQSIEIRADTFNFECQNGYYHILYGVNYLGKLIRDEELSFYNHCDDISVDLSLRTVVGDILFPIDTSTYLGFMIDKIKLK